MPSTIHGPSALYPRALRDLSAQLLPRLRLIPEFRCWLPSQSAGDIYTWSSVEETNTSQSLLLWRSFSQGTSLLILLDLLGPRTGGSPLAYREDENVDAEAESAAFVLEFLRRVEILEAQGRISYGEAFNVELFLDGSCSELTKACSLKDVLKTVCRVLTCLEATYPNFYELPDSIDRRKEDFFEHFVDSETDYLEDLKEIKECIEAIEDAAPIPIAVEYLAVLIDRMVLYQEHIVNYLQSITVRSSDSILWHHLFGLEEKNMYILGCSAYRSYCTQFFALIDFMDALCLENERNETLHTKCSELSRTLTLPVDHVLSFVETCSSALGITHPVENPTVFETLCSTHFTLLNLRDDILEMMQGKRTAYAKRYFSNCALHTRLNMECLALGEFIFDDCFCAQLQSFPRSVSSHGTKELALGGSRQDHREKDKAGSCVYGFLFERMLFLGRPLEEEEPFSSSLAHRDFRRCYHACRWNLGSAIRSGGIFDIVCAISLTEILHVYRPDIEDFAINVTWVGTGTREGGSATTVSLVFYDREQLGQWMRMLSRLAPADSILWDIDECEECVCNPLGSSNTMFLDDLEFSGRRTGSKPRPWSVIARKEGTLASSLYLFTRNNASEPSLFSSGSAPPSSPRSHVRRYEHGLPASPRSMSPVRSYRSGGAILESAKLVDAVQSIEAVLQENDPPDLTGQIRRIGNYPAAHGGFSDVWKCNWLTGSQCCKVAVKVLRGKLLNVEQEDKMTKRLQHEIKVWKRLDHENVVPLLGTCSDLGRYLSLVCPWYENGSLYHYVRKHQDELKLPERVKILSDIAAGLAYLHSCSVVHGDLSSANVLVSDNGLACLCDFGLSTLVEELVDSWYPSSMLGGAIRWSAPELYCMSNSSDCDRPGSASASAPAKMRVSASSDIYSYGSIALEVLSGKVPYYNLKHDGQVLIELSKNVKPQRTASPFLTNEMWEFIGECWNDNPGARPSTMNVSSQMRVLHQRTLARHSM